MVLPGGKRKEGCVLIKELFEQGNKVHIFFELIRAPHANRVKNNPVFPANPVTIINKFNKFARRISGLLELFVVS